MQPDYSTILIVDNAAFIRMVIRLRLEGAGVAPHNIHEAENGQEAYDFLTAKGIANILCDYEMAVMNGIALATRLLITEQRQGLRFILFSGTPFVKITAALAATGSPFRYSPKPGSGKIGPKPTSSAPGFRNWLALCPGNKNNTVRFKIRRERL